MNLLISPPSAQLGRFLVDYQNLFSIDKDKAELLIKEGQKYYQDTTFNAQYQKWIIAKWYESLPSKPRYDLYNHEYYFTEMWSCWAVYSRRYLASIQKKESLNAKNSIFDLLKNVKTVADLGCGIGYSTAALKQIFPNAQVYGTNIPNTKQYKFCELMAKRYNFSVKPSLASLPKIDFLFASEYYEHIYDALDETEATIRKLSPRFLFIANSFNTISFGHFKEYKGYKTERTLNQKFLSKNFNKLLKHLGYKKIKTKLWNNKPALWTKA